MGDAPYATVGGELGAHEGGNATVGPLQTGGGKEGETGDGC